MHIRWQLHLSYHMFLQGDKTDLLRYSNMTWGKSNQWDMTCNSQQLLEKRLNAKGFQQSMYTPGLWLHESRPIAFSLVVDDFNVRYIGKENAQYLLDCLHEPWTFHHLTWLEGQQICRHHIRLGLQKKGSSSLNPRICQQSTHQIPTLATTKMPRATTPPCHSKLWSKKAIRGGSRHHNATW